MMHNWFTKMAQTVPPQDHFDLTTKWLAKKYPTTTPPSAQTLRENAAKAHQRNLDYARQNGIEVTPDGHLVLYHGTRSAPKIRNSRYLHPGSWLSHDPEVAKRFGMAAQARGKPEVMKLKVPPGSVFGGNYWTTSTMVPLQEM